MHLDFCAIDTVLSTDCVQILLIMINFIFIKRRFIFNFTDWLGVHSIHSQWTQLLSSSDRWRWCSYSSTCTYFHVQATLGVWQMAFTIRRSPYLHILVYKTLPNELPTDLFLLVITKQWNENDLEKTITKCSLDTNGSTAQARSQYQPGTSRVHCRWLTFSTAS